MSRIRIAKKSYDLRYGAVVDGADIHLSVTYDNIEVIVDDIMYIKIVSRSRLHKRDEYIQVRDGDKLHREIFLMYLNTKLAKMYSNFVPYTSVTEYRKNAVVHHIDGNKFNNRVSNLALVSRSAHTSYHRGVVSLNTRGIQTKQCLTPIQGEPILMNLTYCVTPTKEAIA